MDFRRATKILIPALTLLTAASACTPAQFRQIPTAESAKLETPATPTPMPTATPSPTATPAPQPTATPAPTATPQPQPTPNPTATPRPPVPTPSPTPAPVTKNETFDQDENAGKVDILIIDDNSYSMEPEQKKMGARFPSFVSALADLDYHIAVTTTDADSKGATNLSGRTLPWTGWNSNVLTPLTPLASTVFNNTIKRSETIGCGDRGDCPSGNEQPMKATILAMQKRLTENRGVFRDGVDLAVVVLSDEDELSNAPSNATKAQDVIDAFKAQFGETKRLRGFGIIVQSGDTKCLAAQRAQTDSDASGYYGTRAEDLARLTGGITRSICDSDYSASLKDISNSVRKLIGTFELAAAGSNVIVTLTPAPAKPIGYHVEGKNLIFDTPPAAGTRIDVTYQVP